MSVGIFELRVEVPPMCVADTFWPASSWWPLTAVIIRDVLHDSSKCHWGGRLQNSLQQSLCHLFFFFAFCCVHIILYPWLPQCFLPSCMNLIFSLYSSIFIKLIKKLFFFKLDVFFEAWISTALVFLFSGSPLLGWTWVFQYSVFLPAHMPELSALITVLVTRRPFGLVFSFFSCGLLFLAY